MADTDKKTGENPEGGNAAPAAKPKKPSMRAFAAARDADRAGAAPPEKDTPQDGGDTATDAGADKSEKSGSDGGNQPAGDNKTGDGNAAKPDKEKSKKGGDGDDLEPWVKKRFGDYRGQITERDKRIATLEKEVAELKGGKKPDNAGNKSGGADDNPDADAPAESQDEEMPVRGDYATDEEFQAAMDHWVDTGLRPGSEKSTQGDTAKGDTPADKTDPANQAGSEEPKDEKPKGPTRGQLLLAETQEKLEMENAPPEVYETFARKINANELVATDVVVDELLSLEKKADVIEAINKYPATFNGLANRFGEASEETQKAQFHKFVEEVARKAKKQSDADKTEAGDSPSGPEVGDMSGTRATPPSKEISLAEAVKTKNSRAFFAQRDRDENRRKRIA